MLDALAGEKTEGKHHPAWQLASGEEGLEPRCVRLLNSARVCGRVSGHVFWPAVCPVIKYDQESGLTLANYGLPQPIKFKSCSRNPDSWVVFVCWQPSALASCSPITQREENGSAGRPCAVKRQGGAMRAFVFGAQPLVVLKGAGREKEGQASPEPREGSSEPPGPSPRKGVS